MSRYGGENLKSVEATDEPSRNMTVLGRLDEQINWKRERISHLKLELANEESLLKELLNVRKMVPHKTETAIAALRSVGLI